MKHHIIEARKALRGPARRLNPARFQIYFYGLTPTLILAKTVSRRLPERIDANRDLAPAMPDRSSIPIQSAYR